MLVLHPAPAARDLSRLLAPAPYGVAAALQARVRRVETMARRAPVPAQMRTT
jgi:hypothetical protein